jgi:metallophosphoesterase (TIGR03767 family)
VAGAILRRGSAGAYRAITDGPGEPHLVRTDLAGPEDGRSRTAARPLLVFAHATDLQLADVQSPARFEFCNQHVDDPRFHSLVPMHRPQEALTARAAQAMVRTLNSLSEGPRSGADIELVVTTGDAIDNTQWNELRMFLALFEGGLVRPGSGGPRYEGVQSLDWGDDGYWRPDGDDRRGSDWYQRRLGFPRVPGLMDWALRDFRSSGLRLPWLACFGNHEVLVQGLALVTEPLRRHFVGARKSGGSLAVLDLEALEELFIESPETFVSDHQHAVTADPDRRTVSRMEFVEAHFSSLARPAGHGFSAANRKSGTAYYVYDMASVRLICLDTTNAAGAAAGSLDEDQARWLRERLEEVHSQYISADGTVVTTGESDRLVVLFSHHGIDTMTNSRTLSDERAVSGLVGRDEVLALVHRFGNVVAWVNGHLHRNSVTPRPDPLGRSGGFWEITSSALMDWPCQTRLVELIDTGDGSLSIVCTMVDHDGVVRPDPRLRRDGRWLAGLHRELAGNEPWRGFSSPDRVAAGAPRDRNVELRVPAPFPLR